MDTASVQSPHDSLLLPTAWLPPVSYFALLSVDGHFTTEVFESYPKQTCRNRCYIATANKILPLSVPVVRENGSHTLTTNIRLSFSEPWQRNHWKTIESAYRNSAWYLHFYEELREVLFRPYATLVEMNDSLIIHLARVMKLTVACRKTDKWSSVYPGCTDLRNAFDARMPDFANDSGLYPPYFQNFADRYGFQPNLSVIDLLFNCGPDSADYLRALGVRILTKLQ